MIDNEIIKALECCIRSAHRACENRDCPYFYKTVKYSDCQEKLISDAKDLINCQKAEIESLQRRIVFWKEDLNYNPKKERSEAIKEFADRLDEKGFPDDYIGEGVVYVEDIDNLVKEMTGERK